MFICMTNYILLHHFEAVAIGYYIPIYRSTYIHTNHIHIPSIYVVVIKTEINVKQKRKACKGIIKMPANDKYANRYLNIYTYIDYCNCI